MTAVKSATIITDFQHPIQHGAQSDVVVGIWPVHVRLHQLHPDDVGVRVDVHHDGHRHRPLHRHHPSSPAAPHAPMGRWGDRHDVGGRCHTLAALRTLLG